VMAGRFLMVAYLSPYFEARKAEKAKAPPVVQTEKSAFVKHWSKIAIAALILYPVVIVLLVGFQGSLKWSTISASRS
jgi:branched-chain amino acid transport system permease protein